MNCLSSGTQDLVTGTVVYQFNNDTQSFSYIQRIYTNDPTKLEIFTSDGNVYAIFAGAFVVSYYGEFEHRVSALYKWEGLYICVQ